MITKTNLTRNIMIALLAIITPFPVMADVLMKLLKQSKKPNGPAAPESTPRY